jgi:hypothetical protein
MCELSVAFFKKVDVDLITKQIEDFLDRNPDHDLAEVTLTISEKRGNLVCQDAAQNPQRHDVAAHVATLIDEYTRKEGKHSEAVAKISFPD